MRAPKSWFLPRDEDVLSLLRDQAVTVHGVVQQTMAWARTELETGLAIESLRAVLPDANEQRRRLHTAVQASFSTPLQSEDLFELSERIDEVANASYELIREAQLTRTSPDPGLREMVAVAADAYALLVEAVSMLPKGSVADMADRASDVARRAEHAYHRAIESLEDETDLRHEVRRRELYRRAEHLTGSVSRVARRIWYAVSKAT